MNIPRGAQTLLPSLTLGFLLTGQVFGQAPPLDDRRSLIEQKLRLVETLVSTQAAKSVMSAGQPSERLEQGTQALIKARQAIHDNRLDEAGRILDAALRTSASPRTASASASLSGDALRQRYQNLMEQVATYRGAIEDISTRERDGKAVRELLAQIDRRSAEARRLAVADQAEAASNVLAETYRHAITELSRLRAGEEVVQSLNFGSPAEEFAYETRRYESTQMLVSILIRDGKDEGERRPVVRQYMDEARRQHDAAVSMARPAGQYGEAIPLMERAVGQLNRALQVMGLQVQ